MLYSDEKTHAGFKTALDEVCQVVRPCPELSAVKDAMDVYKKRHGKEDQRKQQAGSRSVSLLVKTRQGSIYLASSTSCSLRSKRFRAVSGQSGRGRNGIFAFGRAENGSRTKKWKREEEGKEKNDSFLSPPPPPTPLPYPIFYSTHFSRVFLAPEPHGNDCCAGYTSCYIDVFQIIQNCNYSFNHTATGDIEMIKQLYSITFSISFLFYAEVFKHMLCL